MRGLQEEGLEFPHGLAGSVEDRGEPPGVLPRRACQGHGRPRTACCCHPIEVAVPHCQHRLCPRPASLTGE